MWRTSTGLKLAFIPTSYFQSRANLLVAPISMVFVSVRHFASKTLSRPQSHRIFTSLRNALYLAFLLR